MRKLMEQLFSLYYRDVWQYLYSLSHDAALSEELASETFLEAVGAIAAFRAESDVKTWLFSIARHRWYAWLRKKGRSPVTEELSDLIAAPGKAPEEAYIRQEMTGRILQLLEMEPQRTKDIVLMRAEGYSFREIAKKWGITESSARVTDFRVRTKLRKILTEEGYTYE